MSRNHKILTLSVVVFLSLLLPQFLYSTQAAGPIGVIIKFDTTHINGSSLNISFTVYAVEKFYNGAVYILTASDTGVTPDSIPIWTGNSDSDTFYRSFNYTIHLAVGKMASFGAGFQCHFRQHSPLEVTKDQYYLWRLPDVVLMARWGDYLDTEELRYELEKVGYRGLPGDSLKTKHPELYEKLNNINKFRPHFHK
jgi:hypothetical protein